MKPWLIIAFTGLVSTAVAAPNIICSQGSPTLSLTRTYKRINDCEESTFQDRTSDGSPLVADCQQLANNISGNGSWTMPGFRIQRRLASYGSCAFGAAAFTIGTHIGNEDMRDIIESSIFKFQRDGKVGAKGKMACGPYDLHWGIYHT